jgi:cytochrome c-type biogenesis protein CcmH/NrfF
LPIRRNRARRAGARARQCVLFALLLLGGSLALRGDTGWTPRALRIGRQIICTCGCTQGALVCNHVGCPVVTQMRAEIRQRAATSESDELVLQSFVQEYGTQVLANPTTHGFNLVAWIMPWIALGIGLGMVLGFVKHMREKARARASAAVGGDSGAERQLQAEVQADIQAELDREWKR